ncbi:MAG: flagellar basal body rod protein FlgC [Candidatus Marinimicrobia bacterium]|nr:flagellar basal body rod protein FlgC [Candidatus Neomarinimicrobiota bacterium]
MSVDGIFSSFQITLRGLRTEMKKLEAISENVANAERAPDKDGKIYKRKIVLSAATDRRKNLDFENQMNLKLQENESQHITRFRESKENPSSVKNERFFEVVDLPGEKLVYNPAHPRANAEGYVCMPKINMVEEMVDLMAASRAYEANINVMQAGKKMAADTLKI